MIEGQYLIGENTAELMQALDEAYADQDCQIIEVMTIAVVEGEDAAMIHWRASQQLRHRQYGLICMVKRQMDQPDFGKDDDDED